MALLKPNLQDVSLEGPPRMEIGLCDCLESVKVIVNPPAGDKAASIDVTFQDGNREPGDERQVRKTFAFSEKALFYLKRWLTACGREDLANAEEMDSDDLLGLKCKAVIIDEPYTKDGETRVFSNISRFIIPDPE